MRRGNRIESNLIGPPDADVGRGIISYLTPLGQALMGCAEGDHVRLDVDGELPTPCHTPVWDIDDDGTTIAVTLESATAPDAVCTQVLEPVQVTIGLGSFSEGSRTVTLNGEEVGSFSA